MNTKTALLLTAGIVFAQASICSAAPAEDSSAEAEAKAALCTFHENITTKNLSAAWETMAPQFRSTYLYNYECYVMGFDTTLCSVPSFEQATVKSPDEVNLRYTLKAADTLSDTQIRAKTYSGSAVLQRINGKWIITDNAIGEENDRPLDAENSAITMLELFHQCISCGNLKSAWRQTGFDYQQKCGSFTNFEKKYAGYSQCTVTDSHAETLKDGRIKISYSLHLQKAGKGGRTTSKDVTASAIMRSEPMRWVVSEFSF